MKFRTLRASEIECRINTINDKGLSLLLYKDARVDMRLLDETVGPLNWQRCHQVINGNLYCTIEVWDEDKRQWISKQDVGTESYTEKEKGQASDSFKRAGFNFGIGRELYTAPFIWIPSSECTIKQYNQKYVCYDRFNVASIRVEDGTITLLEIVNTKTGKVVYRMEIDTHIDEAKYNVLKAKAAEKGKDLMQIINEYGKTKGCELTIDEWKQIMARLDA